MWEKAHSSFRRAGDSNELRQPGFSLDQEEIWGKKLAEEDGTESEHTVEKSESLG